MYKARPLKKDHLCCSSQRYVGGPAPPGPPPPPLPVHIICNIPLYSTSTQVIRKTPGVDSHSTNHPIMWWKPKQRVLQIRLAQFLTAAQPWRQTEAKRVVKTGNNHHRWTKLQFSGEITTFLPQQKVLALWMHGNWCKERKILAFPKRMWECLWTKSRECEGRTKWKICFQINLSLSREEKNRNVRTRFIVVWRQLPIISSKSTSSS